MASSLWPDSESKRNAARRVRRFSSVRDLRMDSRLSISCSLNWTGLRFLGKGMTPLKHKLDQMYRYLENDDLAWLLSGFYFLTFGGFVAFSIYLPTLLKDEFHLTPADAGFRTAGFVVLATLL